MAGRARRAHGGTVRKLASGRWQVRVRDRATNRLTSLGTFATKADANAALTGAAADSMRGGFISPERGRVTLRDYATEWLAEHPTLADSTRELYTVVLDRHILAHLGDALLVDIEPATVERWYGRLTSTTSAGQRAKAYRILRTVLNHAVQNNRIIRNPCMIKGGGKETAPERPVASIPQVMALADAFPDRLSTIVLIAAFGSLRIGEAAGLRRGDVDPLGSRIHVRRQVQRRKDGSHQTKDPKADSHRTVSLPPQVMDRLVAHMDVHTGPSADAPVFTKPHGTTVDHLYVGRFWREAREVVVKLDPTLPAGLRFHDLRGTGASLASAEGASLREVMARLGHSSVRAAMIYQHATADRDQAIAGLLGRAIELASTPTHQSQS